MSEAEGEWAYLQRNIEAQKLGAHRKVTAALAEARGLEDAVYFDVVAERGHKAVGMDGAGLRALTRDLLLEAEARALPAKVAILRDGVAAAVGGWLQWGRFDVAADLGSVDKAFAGRGSATAPAPGTCWPCSPTAGCWRAPSGAASWASPRASGRRSRRTCRPAVRARSSCASPASRPAA